jgi:hypothetical protein
MIVLFTLFPFLGALLQIGWQYDSLYDKKITRQHAIRYRVRIAVRIPVQIRIQFDARPSAQGRQK